TKYTSTAEFCTLWAARAIGRVLRGGVTSIAVPGGKWFTDVTVREAVEGGLLEAPPRVVAVRALSNCGGVFSRAPDPPQEGAQAGMPLAPVLTSPWIAAEHGGAGRGWVIGCGIACARSSTPPSRCFAMRAIAAYR